MPQKKKRGVDDQQRLAVQSRTFTNWVNDKLTDPKINNLAKQLDDGTVLIELLQNLSGKIVPERWVKLLPTTIVQCENFCHNCGCILNTCKNSVVTEQECSQ